MAENLKTAEVVRNVSGTYKTLFLSLGRELCFNTVNKRLRAIIHVSLAFVQNGKLFLSYVFEKKNLLLFDWKNVNLKFLE